MEKIAAIEMFKSKVIKEIKTKFDENNKEHVQELATV